MNNPVCVLVLIGVVTMIAHSQETACEIVSPSEGVPGGKAPRMQGRLLNPGEPTKQYAVIFYEGDEAFAGLLDFAETIKLQALASPLSEH